MNMPERIATPEVSVVIPTRDRSRLLALTLRSVRWQRGVDLEVLVVDDGSTDDTAEVVAAIADPRIRLVRQPVAQGVSAARNRGIAEAGGTWVAFLDDDDLWAPDKLVRQLQAAHQTGRAWVYTGEVNVDQQLRVIDGVPPIDMTIAGGVAGDVATAAIVVNAIPSMLAARPGLLTMKDLPLVHALNPLDLKTRKA